MPTIASGFRLANGVKIPCIGLGTWQVPDDEKLIEHIHDAISIGYRHIDTAFIYGNEAGVGKAVRTCGVPREKIFVTSKLWNADRGYDAAMRAFDAALQKMDLSYLDLFLIHWPAAKGEPMTWQSINSGTWRALEDLYEQGVVRAIGVSNFLSHHLVPLLARARIAPMVNQILLRAQQHSSSSVVSDRTRRLGAQSASDRNRAKAQCFDRSGLFALVPAARSRRRREVAFARTTPTQCRSLQLQPFRRGNAAARQHAADGILGAGSRSRNVLTLQKSLTKRDANR